MKTAFVFPGQGSQSVGMGKDLEEKYFDRANEVLGFNLKQLCFEGPEDALRKTEVQQPAIFTVSAAAFKKLNYLPQAVAGHSLGEYSALFAAGALSFEDGVKIVRLRGKFMQEAVAEGEGAMSAIIGSDRSIVENICREIGNVWPANFNSPGQIVISGKKEAVAMAGDKLKLAGAKKVFPLAVSAPFHCPLMQPAADKLAAELEKIKINDAAVPFLTNVTAQYVTKGDEIKKMLIKQVTSPVLWEDLLNRLIADAYDSFVEVGPGSVLVGLIKKINKDVAVKSYAE